MYSDYTDDKNDACPTPTYAEISDAAQMMEYYIFKIHQYREAYTSQNNQQGYIDRNGLCPVITSGLPRFPGNVEKPALQNAEIA